MKFSAVIFTVHVNGLSGRLCTIPAGGHWTLKRLMEAIARETGIAVNQQRLADVTLRQGVWEDVESILFLNPELTLKQLDLKIQAETHVWCRQNLIVGVTLIKRTLEQAIWLQRMQDGDVEHLAYAPLEVTESADIILAAAKSSSKSRRSAFQFAGPGLKAYRQFALKMIRIQVDAFKYASEQLRNDAEFVLEAIRQGGKDISLEYVSDDLKRDHNFLLAAIRLQPCFFHCILRLNRVSNLKDFAIAAVQCNWELIKVGLGMFEEDRDVVLAAVRTNWQAFRFTKIQFRDDQEIALAAASQSSKAFLYGGSQFAPELDDLVSGRNVDASGPCRKRRKLPDD